MKQMHNSMNKHYTDIMKVQTNTLKEFIKDNKGESFTIENIGLNSASTLHRHDFYQIIILREGHGVHLIDFEHYEMNAPCVCLVFPQQIHKMTLSDDAQGEIIMFDDTIFCSAILANELKEYNVDLQKRINFVDFKDNLSSFEDIHSVVGHIKSMQIDLNVIRRMQIKFFIKIIIFKIIGAASNHAFVGTKNREFDIYMDFRRLVDEEFEQNRKVEFYCEKLNVSAKKLNSVCKQYAHNTALYIIHERLSTEIKKIFVFDDISLKEIAYKLGFDSQSALNKYIASKFGQTPSELKREVMNSFES